MPLVHMIRKKSDSKTVEAHKTPIGKQQFTETLLTIFWLVCNQGLGQRDSLRTSYHSFKFSFSSFLSVVILLTLKHVVVLIYAAKRIHFGDDTYEMRIHLAILDLLSWLQLHFLLHCGLCMAFVPIIYTSSQTSSLQIQDKIMPFVSCGRKYKYC